MRCATGVAVGLIGTSFFVGVILGNLLLSRIADLYGRVRVIRISLLNTTFCYLLIFYLNHNIYALYAIYFLFGITSTFRMGAGFLYSMEIVRDQASSMTGSMINFCDALHVMCMSLYFYFVSKNWLYIYSFYTCLIAIAATLSFTLPESPAWLLNSAQYEQAVAVFNRIARMNGKNQLPLETQLQKEYVPQESLEGSTIFHMINAKVFRINLAVITCSWVAAGYTYFFLQFYVKQIGGSLFVNTFFSSVAEATACILSGIVATKLGAKDTIRNSIFMAFVFGVLASLFKNADILLMAFFVIGAKFGSTSAYNLCFITTSAYFPVIFSSQVFGFVNLVTQTLLTTASIVSELPPPYPMLVFSCFCTLSFTTIHLLRSPPNNVISASRKQKKENSKI